MAARPFRHKSCRLVCRSTPLVRASSTLPAAVAFAEPVYIFKVARAPNDTMYAESLRSSGMWHLRKVRG